MSFDEKVDLYRIKKIVKHARRYNIPVMIKGVKEEIAMEIFNSYDSEIDKTRWVIGSHESRLYIYSDVDGFIKDTRKFPVEEGHNFYSGTIVVVESTGNAYIEVSLMENLDPEKIHSVAEVLNDLVT